MTKTTVKTLIKNHHENSCEITNKIEKNNVYHHEMFKTKWAIPITLW